MVQQTCKALIELSQYRLTTTAHSLMTLLDNINNSAQSQDESGPGVEILQSQLFILKILGSCMSQHWKSHRERQVIQRNIEPNGSGESPPATLDDPPPLEETLAKFILEVVTRILRTSIPEFIESTTLLPPLEREHSHDSRTNIMSDLCKHAGRVLFYISASNWATVFSRLKARLHFLALTSDENADSSEIRLLEYYNLNAKRLSNIIQG